jgi:hypothetical protein
MGDPLGSDTFWIVPISEGERHSEWQSEDNTVAPDARAAGAS